MMTPKAMSVAFQTDADLVGETLSGNRDAFGRIVARYQSLICSLAYSATGSLGQSEDLAQETFIAAWKHLGQLRERDKLRAWLCGIARNRINVFLRREGREPVREAEPLENASESHSSEPSPPDYAMSREEEAILWRSLQTIPDIYREPLILFYREHESAARVAEMLELSEDAVHQRLSRGRKLLQEQVVAFVEGALGRTTPGKQFTANCMAALPLLAKTTNVVAASVATAKGTALAKTTGLGALFQAILKVILPVGMFVSLGGWLGYKMGGDAGQSPQKRESVARFWAILAASMVAFVLLPLLLILPLMAFFGSKENFLTAMRIWLDILYGLVVAALVLWIWQRRKLHQQGIVEAGVSSRVKTFFIWSVALATTLAASFFALGLTDSNWKVQYLDTSAVHRLIANDKNTDMQICILQYQNGRSYFFIKLLENGRLSKFDAVVDDGSLALLKARGIACPIYVQGRDFEIFGWQGKLLMGLFLFVLAAGVTALMTLYFKNKSNTPIMTKGTKIGIVAVVVLAALIVTPLAWLNHRKANTVHPNQIAPGTLTPERAAQAKQIAKDFFEAMGKGDWTEIDRLCPPGFPLSSQLDDQTKTMLNGLKLVSLGTPFTKPGFPQVWVPYEIQFRTGETKKFNLSVRQDNPDHKWYFDGGF